MWWFHAEVAFRRLALPGSGDSIYGVAETVRGHCGGLGRDAMALAALPLHGVKAGRRRTERYTYFEDNEGGDGQSPTEGLVKYTM